LSFEAFRGQLLTLTTIFMTLGWVFAGEKRVLDSELWHACAGPLVSLPAVGSRVVYFPQGHSEQVSWIIACTEKSLWVLSRFSVTMVC